MGTPEKSALGVAGCGPVACMNLSRNIAGGIAPKNRSSCECGIARYREKVGASVLYVLGGYGAPGDSRATVAHNGVQDELASKQLARSGVAIAFDHFLFYVHTGQAGPREGRSKIQREIVPGTNVSVVHQETS